MENADAANSRRDAILGVTITFLSLSWTAVLLRHYVRAIMMRNYGWDDAAMLLAAIVYTMYCSFTFLCVSYGFGNPNILLISPDRLAELASYLIACFSLYAATMVIVKISLGIFYLRIAVEKWQRWTVYIIVGISSIFGTYFFFAAIFQCGNPAHFLANAVMGKCKQPGATLFGINMTAGVINAVSDFILAALPISLIRKAAMPKAAKISACLVLLLGSVGTAISLVRLNYIRGLTYGGNFFESGVSITIWSLAEAGICIVAVSLITLRPLFRSCMENTRRAITPSLGNSGSGPKRSGISSTANSTKWGSHQITAGGAGVAMNPTRPLSQSSLKDMSGSRNSSGWLPLQNVRDPENHLDDRIGSNVTRRASLHRGKVQWKEDRVGTPPIFYGGGHSAVPLEHSQQTPNTSPPASLSLSTAPMDPSTRHSRRISSFNMSKPSPSAWPKSPSRQEPLQPFHHADLHWQTPIQHPESTRSDSLHLPLQSPHQSGATFAHTQLGPYESYGGTPDTNRLSDFAEPVDPKPPPIPAQYAPQPQPDGYHTARSHVRADSHFETPRFARGGLAGSVARPCVHPTG